MLNFQIIQFKYFYPSQFIKNQFENIHEYNLMMNLIPSIKWKVMKFSFVIFSEGLQLK